MRYLRLCDSGLLVDDHQDLLLHLMQMEFQFDPILEEIELSICPILNGFDELVLLKHIQMIG